MEAQDLSRNRLHRSKLRKEKKGGSSTNSTTPTAVKDSHTDIVEKRHSRDGLENYLNAWRKKKKKVYMLICFCCKDVVFGLIFPFT